jgi:hypothetical protein
VHAHTHRGAPATPPTTERILAHLDAYRRSALGRPTGVAEKFFGDDALQAALADAKTDERIYQQFKCGNFTELGFINDAYLVSYLSSWKYCRRANGRQANARPNERVKRKWPL